MNIVYQIRPVRSGNKFPDDINLSELENKIQGSFKIKGEKVIDGYFDEESEYSKTGIDIISLGFITHSAKALDIALEIK